MEQRQPNIIVEKTLYFSIEIIKFAEILEDKRKFVIARQLLRAGVSIGANVREAQNAESRTDFIHKMKIAAKEAEETKYWLLLCSLSESYPTSSVLNDEINIINKLLTRIISTARNNYKK